MSRIWGTRRTVEMDEGAILEFEIFIILREPFLAELVQKGHLTGQSAAVKPEEEATEKRLVPRPELCSAPTGKKMKKPRSGAKAATRLPAFLPGHRCSPEAPAPARRAPPAAPQGPLLQEKP